MKLHLQYIIFLLSAAILSPQQDKEEISGLWLNHEGTSVIEIYEEQDKFYGRIHEILQFPKNQAVKYSEEQLQKGKERMKGRLVLTDLSYIDGKWINGRILDPKDNSTRAKCSLGLSEDKQSLLLKIRKGIFSTTKTWSRVKQETNDED